MAAKIREMWMVHPYQHGRLDPCDGGQAFETEEAAMDAARDFASEVPYDGDTEHECVVFKAIASFRGRLEPERHAVKREKGEGCVATD
jgi:hypothetical protein